MISTYKIVNYSNISVLIDDFKKIHGGFPTMEWKVRCPTDSKYCDNKFAKTFNVTNPEKTKKFYVYCYSPHLSSNFSSTIYLFYIYTYTLYLSSEQKD